MTAQVRGLPMTAAQKLLVHFRRLPPEQQERVLQLAESLARQHPSGTDGPSLLGLCADLGPAPSTEDIRRVREEVWRNFPREDLP